MLKDQSQPSSPQPIIYFRFVRRLPSGAFEPTLQCAKGLIMLVTKFASARSTGFKFRHQSFDLLAASPLPNASLSDFRHTDSASRTRRAG
jgi:hypothetical protein